VEGWLCRHLIGRIGNAVDGPLIEPVESGVLFFEKHFEDFIGLRGGGNRVAEVGVVPLEGLGRDPLGLAF